MSDFHTKFTYNYVLDKIQSKIYVKDIISFDVETHNNNQSFTLGSIYDGETHQTFYDRVIMRDKLLNTRYQNTLLVATNLQFDFCSLENMSEFYKYDIITRGGRFIMLKKRVRYENKKHEGHDVTFSNTFIDSLNHYAGSVESAGKIIGTHKLDQPVYLGKEPRYDVKAKVIIDKETNEIKELDIDEWEYLLQYNHGDTIVTYKLMKFLQDTYNQLGCEMKTTISSTALDLWRRKYLPCTMYKEEFVLGYDIKHEIFKCYYGGRTEIFARGLIESTKDKKWKLLDINSLYPAMMCNEYPLPQSIQKPSQMTIKNIIDYEGFSDVEVECKEMYYPLLPFRDFKRGKLIFPCGRWRGSYTNLELRRALELGYKINKIYLQYIYTQKFKPFESYVLDLYKKRLEYQKEKSPMEVVTKLLLNSMYGKLGQKDFVEYQWFDISLMTGDEYNQYLDSIDSTTFGNLGFKRVIKECNANFIFPILPAYVTAYGRLKIYDELVKYKGIYCDTDSVITCEECQTSNKLGELKVEDEIKKAILIRPKLYMKMNELNKVKVKIKGIPKATITSFEKILQHDRVYYSKFTKPNESIRHGYKINEVRQDSKSVSVEDNKRLWSKPFDYTDLDYESKPIMINEPTLYTLKGLRKRTVREKMLQAEHERNKVHIQLQQEFIESDLFDSSSVGSDISSEEFLKNEEWFDKRGL